MRKVVVDKILNLESKWLGGNLFGISMNLFLYVCLL